MSAAADREQAFAMAPMVALWDAEAKRVRRRKIDGIDPLAARVSFAEGAAAAIWPRLAFGDLAVGCISHAIGATPPAQVLRGWPLASLVCFRYAYLIGVAPRLSLMEPALPAWW